jgi:hypothetical protein
LCMGAETKRRWPRQDTVLFLSCLEAQKLRFQGKKPLCCASRLLPPGSRNVAGPVSTPPAPAPPRCAGVGPPVALVCATRTAAALPASTRNRTGGRPWQHRQRVTGDLREKQKHRKSLRRTVAALAPVCWLAPAPGTLAAVAAVPTGGVKPRKHRTLELAAVPAQHEKTDGLSGKQHRQQLPTASPKKEERKKSLRRRVAAVARPYCKRRATRAPERRRPSTNRSRFVTMVAGIAGVRFQQRFRQHRG